MPESFVQVNEGTGKKLHSFQRTIGANIVEEGAALLAEPSLPSYAAVGSAAIATNQSHMLQIMAGAALRVYVRRIRLFQNVFASGAGLTELRVVRLTSAGTGGGAITVNPLDPADPAAGATAMTLPTVKGAEGALLVRGSVNRVASGDTGGVFVLWEENPRQKALIIPAGVANGIAVRNNVADAGASFLVNIDFDEVPY